MIQPISDGVDRQSRPPSVLRANVGLLVLWLACTLSFIDRQILNLLVEPIRRDIAMSDLEISILQGFAFSAFYALSSFPIARLADKGNRTHVVAAGILFWSFMTIACSAAQSFAMLFIARMGVGLGEAALGPATYSLLSDLFRPARLARAIGIFGTGITIGIGAAYIAGGQLSSYVDAGGSLVLPWAGELSGWQAAFLFAGLPGLVLAPLVLLIGEPDRHGHAETANDVVVPLRGVLVFIGRNWRVYAPIFGGISLLSLVSMGIISWYPSFLVRTYGEPLGSVGLCLGLAYLVAGTAGGIAGPRVAEALARWGYRDANLRCVLLIALVLIPLAVLGPLAPTFKLAMAVAAVTIFVSNAFFGVMLGALQLVTPNRMRAVASSILNILSGLIGLGFGPMAVALCTDLLFADDLSIRYSLSLVALIGLPCAAIVVGSGLKAYGAMLQSRSGRA